MPEPSIIKVEPPAVTVPLEKFTLPETVQVPEPKDMDGVPVEALVKLISPVIVTMGLLAAQLRASAPAPVVWTSKFPLSIRLPDIINV